MFCFGFFLLFKKTFLLYNVHNLEVTLLILFKWR